MSLSKRLRFQVLVRDNYTCQYCGACPPDTVLEIDHVIPRSKGGSDRIDNLKTACWNCNRGKSAALIPRIVTLGAGPDYDQGPRFGEALTTSVQYPCYWVYESGGAFDLFEDEIDADLYHTKWEPRLKWGHPGGQLGYEGRRHIWEQWNRKWSENEIGSVAWRAKRTLVGFYITIIPDSGFPPSNELAWFPGATAFEYWLRLETQSLPDYEGEE